MKFEGKIPEKFFRVGDGKHPRARNVGQLMKLLEELPKSLPVGEPGLDGDPDAGVSLVVFNRTQGDVHLQFEDPADY